MRQAFRKFSISVLGGARHFSFEHRMLNVTNLGAFVFVEFNAGINAFLGLNHELIFVCAFCGFVSLVLYICGRLGARLHVLIIPSIANILGMMVVGFFLNGGSHGGSQYYIFLALIASIMMVRSRHRLILGVLYGLVITALVCIEWYIPQSVIPYPSNRARILDVWLSVVGTGIGVAVVLAILIDNYRLYQRMFLAEKRRSDRLFRNSVPKSYAQKLMQGHLSVIESHPSVSVLYCDIVGFTPLVARLDPYLIIPELGRIFSVFDQLVEKFGVVKVTTVGDAYMVVAGIQNSRSDHAQACFELGQAMLRVCGKLTLGGEYFLVRIGIHSGPVVAGVVGRVRAHFDLWGHTVNMASSLQTIAEPGCICFGDATRDLLNDSWGLQPLGLVDVMDSEPMRLWCFRCDCLDT